MKLKIEQLAFKDVNTSRGMSKQVGIRVGQLWYNGWAGKWSDNLKIGDEVEVDVTEVTKNGTTYRNIKPPKAAAPAAAAASPELMLAVKELTAEIKNLASSITMLAMSQGNEAPPDAPPPEEGPEEEGGEPGPTDGLPF